MSPSNTPATTIITPSRVLATGLAIICLLLVAIIWQNASDDTHPGKPSAANASGMIHGCFENDSGTLRIASKESDCNSSTETALIWQEQVTDSDLAAAVKNALTDLPAPDSEALDGDSGGGATGDTGPTGSAGPQGATGATGVNGLSAWSTVSAWSSTTAYTSGPPASVVTHAGGAYVAVNDNIGQPPNNAGDWAQIAKPGKQGIQGIPGPPGPPGAVGEDGVQGTQGPAAWSALSPWNSTAHYTSGPPASVVTYNGGTYAATSDNTGQAPHGNPHWIQIAAPGNDGQDGAPGKNGVSGWELVHTEDELGPGRTHDILAVCPPGKKVTGGGLDDPRVGNPLLQMRESYPRLLPDGDWAWWVRVHNPSSSAILTGVAYAICITAD